MTSAWTRDRARARIETLSVEELGDRELRRQVLSILAGQIGFRHYVWLLTDPVTEVGAAPLAQVPCLPELPALIRAKYATAVNRWTALRGQASPVGLLTAATGGRLARSRVWREVLSRYGVGDVASVVFADSHGCWGFLDLWRDRDRGPFTPADAAFLAGLAPPLAGALRRCQARTFAGPAVAGRHDLGPVVLTLDEELTITSRTSASQAWLDVLLPPGPDQQTVPASVYNVTAQLLALEEGVDHHPPFARTHLAGGFWLTLRAARLDPDAVPGRGEGRGSGPAASRRGAPGVKPGPSGAGGAAIAVTIEEASAADRLELFSRAFGLTARERELLGLLATGSDTRAMARRMRLSEHTVQDHLKSVFAKTGARDRVTVLSRALGSRALPKGQPSDHGVMRSARRHDAREQGAEGGDTGE